MSVTIVLKERTIKLTENTKPILAAYVEALKETGLKIEATGEGSKTLAAPGETKLRDSFWAKHVTSTLEIIMNSSRGAHIASLGVEELDLEVPSELLLTSYNNFLNDLLLEQEIKVEQAERKEIESKFILVQELLYRLVAIALSNKLDKQNDGENMLACLRNFIKKITEAENLTQKSFLLFDAKNSKFLNKMTLEHPKWLTQIEQMVKIVKLLHQNTEAIKATLNHLKNVEYITQIQLITFLDANQDPIGLSREWVKKTLQASEAKMIQNTNPSTALVVHSNSQMSATQLTVIGGLPRNVSQIKREKITNLYQLLNRTRALYEMMGQLDLLMTYAGWMPILVGLINFQTLGNLIRKHALDSETVLKIEGELESILLSKMGRGLVKYQAVTAEQLSYSALGSISHLNALQDEDLKNRIGRMMSGTMASLIGFQNQLGNQFHFIDTTQIPLTANLLEGMKITHLESETAQLKNEKEGLRLALEYRQSRTQEQEDLNKVFHTLIINGCQDRTTLEILKAQGADLRSFYFDTGYYGYTALHIAASTNNRPVCEWLIAQGVDVNILDAQKKKTPLSVASKRKCKATISYLRTLPGVNCEIIEKLNKEIYAIISDNAITEKNDSVTQETLNDLSEIMLEGGEIDAVNMNANTTQGCRPLHLLLLKGNQKLISHFMLLGANPLLKDTVNQETPYEVLCRVKPVHFEETKKFLDEGFAGQFTIAAVDVDGLLSPMKNMSFAQKIFQNSNNNPQQGNSNNNSQQQVKSNNNSQQQANFNNNSQQQGNSNNRNNNNKKAK